MRRIRDAAGVPKAFAFVEYGDPESVLRCLELLNGVSVIGQDRQQTTLNIKADAKLRTRLDEHEAGRMKTSVSNYTCCNAGKIADSVHFRLSMIKQHSREILCKTSSRQYARTQPRETRRNKAMMSSITQMGRKNTRSPHIYKI